MDKFKKLPNTAINHFITIKSIIWFCKTKSYFIKKGETNYDRFIF
jgi:hypothetical protein